MQTIIETQQTLPLHDTAVWFALIYIAVVLAIAVDFVENETGMKKGRF
ncbi:MAG: hypothetical protein IJV05_07855 [Muribaculaceae bacterium]|nr:hypothetical protein [Muribaculaceae bacterium]